MVTGLVFKWFGMSINTMTLGGLAVAIGELVDDAIVGVENVFRRLRENQHAADPKPLLRVVYEASSEVRNSIVFSTILVVLVFVPLFALSGMEGRLFTPLGVAYIVSILASLVVSLTVTPVLSYWLLPQCQGHAARQGQPSAAMAQVAAGVRHPLQHPASLAGVGHRRRGRAGQPHRGHAVGPRFPAAVQRRHRADQRGLAAGRLAGNFQPHRRRWSKSGCKNIRGVVAFGRRTGRAELDEHAEGVNMSEIIVSFDPNSGRSREEIMADMREELTQVPGAVIAAEQPLQHVIAPDALRREGPDRDQTLRRRPRRLAGRKPTKSRRPSRACPA